MDKITLANPDARILKHMNISIGKIEREAGRFVGMYLPNGYKFENHFDVFEFVFNSKRINKTHISFGKKCSKKNNTGCCQGHNEDDFSAPRDYSITSSTAEEFLAIKNNRFGLIPRNNNLLAGEGDYITLKNPESGERIKCVVTCSHTGVLQDNATVWNAAVALVMQREKPNGKIQYFL